MSGPSPAMSSDEDQLPPVVSDTEFNFDGVKFYLTYAQSADLSREDVIAMLQSRRQLKWARICHEKHKDGRPHIHVVGQFSKRYQSRSCRCFDVHGKHPHIRKWSTIKDQYHIIRYVSKDSEFFDVGTVPESETPKRSSDEAWSLAGDPDEAKYLKACQSAGISYQYAKRIRELTFADVSNTIDALYEACLEWECTELQQQTLPENTSTVLVGPAGCGKSCWAKRIAPKPALWVSHIDVLRQFRPEFHQSIIFDDMVFSHYPVQSQIHIVDWTDARQIHCRYGYATIPAKTVKIFTCNEFPFTNGNAAIARRITVINL